MLSSALADAHAHVIMRPAELQRECRHMLSEKLINHLNSIDDHHVQLIIMWASPKKWSGVDFYHCPNLILTQGGSPRLVIFRVTH